MRYRLMLAFALFALLVASLFGGYALLFAYVVEDQFFNDALQAEAAAQQAHHARSGRWLAPRSQGMQVYRSAAEFPVDLRTRHLAEPGRREFAGDAGRHYHLQRLDQNAFLVAEVKGQLVVRRMRGELLLMLGLSALAVVALALVVGLWLARRTVAPLADLARSVEAMQPDDPPQAFARPFASHEVAVLAKGLAALSARVHAFVEREREFTRDASHELRTPLAVIYSACERLAQVPGLPETAQAQLDFLRQSAWQLQQTVSSLLALAREETAALRAESVPVLPLLEQVVLEQAVLLAGKPIKVQVEVAPRTRISAPPAVLRIVLSNLLGNAFAHSKAGSVRIDVANGRLRISNSDHLPAELNDARFRPFTKGAESTGYGLGLAIVQRLCERHRVDLRIESAPHGTTASLAISMN